MAKILNLSQNSDQELLKKIKENSDNLGYVYKNCKSNSIRFMKKMTSKMNEYELEDVFQDAILVLYEKITKGNFELTCSFQTYLNSVCRIQLLNTFNKSEITVDFIENNEDDDDNSELSYLNITDSLDVIDNTNEPYFQAIEKGLLKIKEAGGHCYELLTLFWYHKKSMNELAETFGYSNADNTKNQKARCQKRLEKLAFNELNN
ncbi:RNA polymerase sigma factor [Flavobacterium sp.]|uniref:RNA polymerase sigma factor n=1 Tax=Flavobacterium sp. TaxID=239 RepID=UPI004047F6D8